MASMEISMVDSSLSDDSFENIDFMAPQVSSKHGEVSERVEILNQEVAQLKEEIARLNGIIANRPEQESIVAEKPSEARPDISEEDLAKMLRYVKVAGNVEMFDELRSLTSPHIPLRNKHWHVYMTVAERQEMLVKLAKAIFPVGLSPEVLADQRVNDLLEYARKVEKDMLEGADDREEYYHLLAEKVCKIQSEMAAKKRARLAAATLEGSTYEGDKALIDKRLRELYPHVNFETTALPTHLVQAVNSSILRVSHHNLRVARMTTSESQPASVRANASCPLAAGVYYYEVHVQESDGFMAIGLCEKSEWLLSRLPGWDHNSYGYHGDDGLFYGASEKGVEYGPTYGKGDVIGCGLNFLNKRIFFTKNGQNLGTAIKNIDCVEGLYPTVGLLTPNSIVDVNFGQIPFQYDISKGAGNATEQKISQ